jgi:hypothetical protein
MKTPLLAVEDVQPCSLVSGTKENESAKYPSVDADCECQAEWCFVSWFASVIG